jgi:hypothetical protein
VPTVVVRVWLPDRPGALGQVASRIGAVRGDVVGIDILERGGGRAVDELVVELPDHDVRDDRLLELLVAEIVQVDGVAVEDVRRVTGSRPDPGLMALELAATLAEEVLPQRLERLVAEVARLVDADWAVALDATTATVLHARVAPGVAGMADPTWLGAFLDGSRHLDDDAQAAGAPGDLAWGWLGAVEVVPTGEVVIAVQRSGRPFHTRERQQIALLCRLTAALVGTVSPA